MIATNPIAMRNFTTKIQIVDGDIEKMMDFSLVSPPFQRRSQNPLWVQVRDFVDKSFQSFGLCPETDKLTKNQAQIMTVRLMHKHQDLDLYDQAEFDRLYDLYEDCEHGHHGVADDGDLGLGRQELTRLFMRVARL